MRPQSVNKEKDAKNEAYHEEPSLTDNPVIKNPNYFNIFECGNVLLNKLNATCKRACMENSRYKYYTEFFRTITYFNKHNDVILLNDNIQGSMHKIL